MVNVLIVDDEVSLLRHLESYLGSFRDEFTIHTSDSAEAALSTIQEHPDLDVVLTDVRLPGLDGIEMIREATILAPGLRFVVMTAYPSRSVRRSANAAGAVRYLEKPLDLKEVRTILLEVGSEDQGWQGSVGGLDIFDFTQLLAMSGKTTALSVVCNGEEGVLAFADGRLTHASAGDLSGDEAFHHLTTLRGGTFRELPRAAVDDYPPNIESSTNHLMMEAARIRDERGRDGDDEDALLDELLADVAAAPHRNDETAKSDTRAAIPAGSSANDEPAPGNPPSSVALSEIGLANLVRQLGRHDAGASARLKTPTSEAQIFCRDGVLVHAAMNGHVGEEVVYALLTWEEAEVEVTWGEEPPETSISPEWSDLLLRAFGQSSGPPEGMV